jgi:hypothetical protein
VRPAVIGVVYGRHGRRYEKVFRDLPSAARWIEMCEGRDEIFAATVLRDGQAIFEHEHPPAVRRWVQLDPETSWPGEHP